MMVYQEANRAAT